MKKKFVVLKNGSWFTYRSALYLKIGPLSVYKISGKRYKLNVNLCNTSKVSVSPTDFFHRSLVTPVKVSIWVK